jgi:hypothetical protein
MHVQEYLFNFVVFFFCLWPLPSSVQKQIMMNASIITNKNFGFEKIMMNASIITNKNFGFEVASSTIKRVWANVVLGCVTS